MKKLLTIIAAVATLVAASIATSACTFLIYQPEEPESLMDE
jgi:cyclic lactone autoinducer peptide